MQHKNPSHPIGSSWQVSAHAGDAFQWFTKRMSWHSWASYVMLDVWGCGKMFFFFSRLGTWNLMLQSLHTGSDLRNISSVWDTIDIYIYIDIWYTYHIDMCAVSEDIFRYLQFKVSKLFVHNLHQVYWHVLFGEKDELPTRAENAALNLWQIILLQGMKWLGRLKS